MFHGQTGFPVDVPLKQPSDLCMSHNIYIYIVSKKAVKNYLTTILESNFTKACIVLVVATYIREKGVSFVDNSTCFIVKSCVYQHYVGRLLWMVAKSCTTLHGGNPINNGMFTIYQLVFRIFSIHSNDWMIWGSPFPPVEPPNHFEGSGSIACGPAARPVAQERQDTFWFFDWDILLYTYADADAYYI